MDYGADCRAVWCVVTAPAEPPDEIARAATLRSLGVLDTGAEERFDAITRLAARLFNVPISLVVLIDTDRVFVKSSKGLDVTQAPRSTSFCGHSILGEEIFVINDARIDRRFFDNPAVTGELGIRFYAGCSLVAQGSKVGTLCIVDNKPRTLSDDDLALLRDLSGLVERELTATQSASTDYLTGLSNRLGFEAIGEHALNLCRRSGALVSLLYFDLDGFKQVNDTMGHAAGDQVLRDFGRDLRKAFRSSDVVARLGGDEFAVLAIGATSEQVRPALDRLRAISSTKFSVGCVDYDGAGTFATLVAAADAKMFGAKKSK